MRVDNPRKIVIASTATGMDAETVIPTLRNRYSEEAPKTIPSNEPSKHRRPGQLGEFGRGGDVRAKVRVRRWSLGFRRRLGNSKVWGRHFRCVLRQVGNGLLCGSRVGSRRVARKSSCVSNRLWSVAPWSDTPRLTPVHENGLR